MRHARASLHSLGHVDGCSGDDVCLEEVADAAAEGQRLRCHLASPLPECLHSPSSTSINNAITKVSSYVPDVKLRIDTNSSKSSEKDA